jgi:glycosyltransferase involved in cell wall biosynthesis
MRDCAGEPIRRPILVVAYYFPPFHSAGVSIRIVKFLKYLPGLGWRPLVLTVDDRREYEHLRRGGSAELLEDLPPQVAIHRTGSGEVSAALLERGRAMRKRGGPARAAIDALRRLRNLATRWLLIPDEQLPWLPSAVRAGWRVIRRERPAAILVTCPPHSAALAGIILKRLTRIPLVLDFRDDWVDTPWFRARPRPVRLINRWLERRAVGAADRVVLVTPASLEAFVRRYPRLSRDRFACIPNGVDLADFDGAGGAAESPPARPLLDAEDGCFTIVHAGLLTVAADWRRSPYGFFRALARIRDADPRVYRCLRVVFTGALPREYREQAAGCGVGDIVQEAGYVPRPAFVALLRRADLLLAINYEGFETLVPGKLYEYWAAGSAPILLLSVPGAAQALVDGHGLGRTLAPDNSEGIADAVVAWCRQAQSGQPACISRDGLEAFDRARLAAHLAGILDEVAPARPPRAE